MAWKTIAAFVSDLAVDGPVLDAATMLAEREDANLEITCLGIDPTQPETYYAGAHALAIALPTGLADAEKQARDLEAAVRERMRDAPCRWSVRAVMTPFLGMTQVIAESARFADVALAALPYGAGKGQAQVSIVEAALFGAEIPVLVLPGAELPETFSHIAVAWNDSPEALRAVRAGLPLIAAAEGVDIVVIDPPQHGPERSDPGGRLAEMLSRHGAKPDVRILARTEPSIAAILARHVRESAADLLVMGAYGHSRLRESILGGATRAMLEQATVPVLMVH